MFIIGKRKSKAKDSNIELKELSFNFYLNPSIKKQYIRIYDVLTDTHDRTYSAIYESLMTNIDEIQKEYEEEAERKISSNFDPEYSDYGDYLEAIQFYVFDRLDEQFLMHYQFKLMSLSNLYQVFEQQLRKWLYEEMTQPINEYSNQVKFIHFNEKNENNFDTFYSDFGKLSNLLAELELSFTNLIGIEELIIDTDIWKIIRECNLISNTYKHGSGRSASNLSKLYPEYFEKIDSTRLMDFYRTTNLERVLSVDKISFKKYSDAMKEFWKNIKEHQSGTVKMEIEMNSDEEGSK
ncbi:hypothetical protein M3649_19375 [Ureibacillus chungkukjangi]|nr:hypothetical protein [Ureibacillus chungkukjangi]